MALDDEVAALLERGAVDEAAERPRAWVPAARPAAAPGDATVAERPPR